MSGSSALRPVRTAFFLFDHAPNKSERVSCNSRAAVKMEDTVIKNESLCEVNIEEGSSNHSEASSSGTGGGLKLRSLKDMSNDSGQDVLADVSSSTGINISLENWPGDCDFRMDKQTQSISEKEKASDATYSEMLDKLFCDINKCFSIRFFVGTQVYPLEELIIR